jgi:hypothetical protein
MNTLKYVCVGCIMAAVGCGGTEPGESSVAANAVQGSKYVVDSEPAGAIPVGEARQQVEDQQDVTLFGTIGGSAEPFVDGLAAFTIVDTAVPYCAADEGCPTPWDYCCTQNQVKDNIATVKVVDDEGNPVADDARALLGVKELSTVVVKGKAQRDDQGNLTIAASEVYVRPGE